MRAQQKSPREQIYLDAAAALFRDGGAGEKSARDQAFMYAMAATHAKYPDDGTKLFYVLSILKTLKARGVFREGVHFFRRPGLGRRWKRDALIRVA
jgi:hypothetical protein